VVSRLVDGSLAVFHAPQLLVTRVVVQGRQALINEPVVEFDAFVDDYSIILNELSEFWSGVGFVFDIRGVETEVYYCFCYDFAYFCMRISIFVSGAFTSLTIGYDT
jgi:hypothetical protein